MSQYMIRFLANTRTYNDFNSRPLHNTLRNNNYEILNSPDHVIPPSKVWYGWVWFSGFEADLWRIYEDLLGFRMGVIIHERVLCLVYSLPILILRVHCTIHCTVYSSYYLFSVHCAMNSVQYTPYTIQWIHLYIASLINRFPLHNRHTPTLMRNHAVVVWSRVYYSPALFHSHENVLSPALFLGPAHSPCLFIYYVIAKTRAEFVSALRNTSAPCANVSITIDSIGGLVDALHPRVDPPNTCTV